MTAKCPGVGLIRRGCLCVVNWLGSVKVEGLGVDRGWSCGGGGGGGFTVVQEASASLCCTEGEGMVQEVELKMSRKMLFSGGGGCSGVFMMLDASEISAVSARNILFGALEEPAVREDETASYQTYHISITSDMMMMRIIIARLVFSLRASRDEATKYRYYHPAI